MSNHESRNPEIVWVPISKEAMQGQVKRLAQFEAERVARVNAVNEHGAKLQSEDDKAHAKWVERQKRLGHTCHLIGTKAVEATLFTGGQLKAFAGIVATGAGEIREAIQNRGSMEPFDDDAWDEVDFSKPAENQHDGPAPTR